MTKQTSSPQKRHARRLPVAFVAGAAMMTFGACAQAEVKAEQWKPEIPKERLVKASSKSELNLLSGGERRIKPRLARTTLGNGRYICSASGFGQKSRCRRN